MTTSSFPESVKRGENLNANKNQALKVFQVLAGGPWGGGAVVVMAITKGLIARGCQVWVLCLDDLVAERFAEAGAHVVRIDAWRRSLSPWHDLMSLGQLYRLCRRERFDLVVTHTSKGGFLGRLAAWLARVDRIIHTVHGFAWHEFSSPAATRFYVTLERFAARFCDLVICVNNQDRIDAINRKVVPPDKIFTVLNGIDLNRFAVEPPPELRRKLAQEEGAFVIGTVGRLAPQKSFEHLIQAMPAVLAEYPRSRLVLAGDGPLEPELKALAAALGVDDRCEFLGFRSDIPNLLACFDVFAQPSLWEGLSITLLEAMAAGKPVVATNIKGTREVVTDGVDGLLVEPANPAALATAISSLAQDRERALAMGAQALETIKQRFSQEAMVQNTLRLYNLALGDPIARPNEASGRTVQPKSVARQGTRGAR